MNRGPIKNEGSEHRKYIRLRSVFPVEYAMELTSQDSESHWEQGFTFNISRGGIGLSINQIQEDFEQKLKAGNLKLLLKIRIPLFQPPIRAHGKVVWIQENKSHIPTRFLLGVEFTSVDPQDSQRMVEYGRWMLFSTRIANILAFLLLTALVISVLSNLGLRASNKALVNNLVRVQNEESQTQKNLQEVNLEKAELDKRLNDYTQNVVQLRKELVEAQTQIKDQSQKETVLSEELKNYDGKINELSGQIQNLMAERIPIENRYAALVEREEMFEDQLALLEQKKTGLQKTVLKKMYQWLKNHQNPETGLVLSFEGDVDVVRYWAFIYDQALAVNAFLLYGDVLSSQKILNFFQKNLREPFGGFMNAYYVDSGDMAEATVHCGPNIWIGIAAMQFTNQTGDHFFLPLAREIGDWLIRIQDEDPAGGLRGGPEFTWFSTEHNLDAYAFFGMLAQVTNEEKYRTAQEKITSWLKTYAMSPFGKDYKSPPVKRGRGDSTIATDAFSWSLAAIGPEKLIDLGMDPEEIMRFAEEHCKVTVQFKRPSGTVVEASGFDFAKNTHLPRGGMISPEWTSQMIVSYQMLTKYFQRKEDKLKLGYYREKARFYLDELNKLIISSPSSLGQGEGCLPYATLEDADTGHGWRTPKGSFTGSIAGTAYMMMAIKEFNPLMLRDK